MQPLAEIIGSLTREEQAAVRDFIEFLRRRGARGDSPFLAAINEFMHEHPELLRHLAE